MKQLTKNIFFIFIFSLLLIIFQIQTVYSQDNIEQPTTSSETNLETSSNTNTSNDSAVNTNDTLQDHTENKPSEPNNTSTTSADEEEPFQEYSPKDKSKDPKDPFKPLITPPPPVTPPQQQTVAVKPKTEVQVPPLPIKVTFIVGSESRRVAVLQLNNKTYDMTVGEQEESGLFKVLEITDTKVKIWDSRVQKERDIYLQGL